jgi:hypothetical protein
MIRLGGGAVVPQRTQVSERPEGHAGQNGVEDRGDDAHDVQPGRERLAGCGQEVAALGGGQPTCRCYCAVDAFPGGVRRVGRRGPERALHIAPVDGGAERGQRGDPEP